MYITEQVIKKVKEVLVSLLLTFILKTNFENKAHTQTN